MKNILFTIVVTVLDEEKSITKLLAGIADQSLQPTQIIISDAGSTDQTRSLIEKFSAAHPELNLKTILAPGTNRSQARNIAIAAASTDHIAVTDAGCVPKKNWLEELAQPFLTDADAQVVAGFYDPAPATVFENVIANVTSTRAWNLRPDSFIPSSRSIAFTKKMWQSVGGYPEQLTTCEDLVFAEKLKARATKWYVNPKALVIWKQPKTFLELQEKIFQYALGDLSAGYDGHVQKIRSAFWRILVLLVISIPLLFASWSWLRMIGFGLIGLYVLGTWLKHRHVLRHPMAFFYTILTQFLVDFSLVQAFIFHQMKKTIK